MAARLPTVGGDDGSWGTVLNEYLSVEHDTNGTHKAAEGLVTENVNTVAASGSAVTLASPTTATLQDITLTANCTVTLPIPVAGQSFTLVVRQDGTGSRTITWSGTIKWPAGVAPTLSTTASVIDILAFFSTDGTSWFGCLSIQNLQ